MIALSVAGTGSWWYTCGFGGCPTVAQLRAWRPSEGGVLLARDSGVVSALSLVRRVNVPLTRVPAHVQRAFVAVEDRRFRDHHGVDWYGVARALVHNVRAGGVREGASTITMQLARNVFLGNRAAERSWARKLLETRYAGLLEQALGKDDILERYLNAIYLGNGVYGVEAASRDLFGKSVRDVTLAEAAMLAGLPKAPSNYSPRNDRRRALVRRNVVLDVL
ncbi:MAG: transglycosylase domain-containing protein, partial [Gemmatimonadaceae bacterium]